MRYTKDTKKGLKRSNCQAQDYDKKGLTAKHWIMKEGLQESSPTHFIHLTLFTHFILFTHFTIFTNFIHFTHFIHFTNFVFNHSIHFTLFTHFIRFTKFISLTSLFLLTSFTSLSLLFLVALSLRLIWHPPLSHRGRG